jgi:ABC-2 type transport system ATP-binding protein
MSIKVEGITKLFGNQKALDEVSFEVFPGEVTGFLGPNGAGKSTMMKIICGYLPSNSGKVEVCGISVQENPLEARRRIGYLPEHNPLYLDMYVLEYLEFVLGLYGKNKNSKKISQDMIERVGLSPEKKKKLGALSKGYRQRVGIAQALIHDPEVLILDEPTSGLDPNQLNEIRNLIADTGKTKTLLFSSHNLPEVEAICKRIIIIKGGKVVANDISKRIKDDLTSRISNMILVEFDCEVESSALRGIEGVQDARKTGTRQYLLKVAPGVDARPAVAKKAQEKNWLVLTMQQKESDLESVFRSLTGGETQH